MAFVNFHVFCLLLKTNLFCEDVVLSVSGQFSNSFGQVLPKPVVFHMINDSNGRAFGLAFCFISKLHIFHRLTNGTSESFRLDLNNRWSRFKCQKNRSKFVRLSYLWDVKLKKLKEKISE